ncbi:hypothetical protein LCGC14_1653530 [marine sediment metagenome]|uniref:DUF2493 domain-containing protein n=1 Tax=marine sediment metagenome TaxID=412755 RepID=A0A0F9HW77_9ZZZZ
MKIMTTLLITGSRYANFNLLLIANDVVRGAKKKGWSIIVGDASGIDKAVIDMCDELGVDVTVYGAYGRIRNATKTGVNRPLGNSRFPYHLRDIHMISKADVVCAIWNGKSKSTLKNYQYAKEMNIKAFLMEE